MGAVHFDLIHCAWPSGHGPLLESLDAAGVCLDLASSPYERADAGAGWTDAAPRDGSMPGAPLPG